MEGKRARSEDAFADLDRDGALELLKRVDAEDVAKFDGRSDQKYDAVVRVLGEEDIWKYWFERDLDIFAMKPEQFLPWKYANDTPSIEAPKWKTVYLWYRLMITGLQWAYINYYLSEGKLEMSALPPGAKLRLVRFNLIEITLGDSSMMVDFKTQFERMASIAASKKGVVPYTFSQLKRVSRNFSNYLNNRYPEMHRNQRTVLQEHLKTLYEIEENYPDEKPQKQKNRGRFVVPYERLYLFARPPRLLEETRLLLGLPLCLTCDSPASHHEKGAPQRTFCSGKCQVAFYQ